MRIWKLILASGLLSTACLAGTIRGTAYDVDGRVVPGARVLLMLDYVKQKEQRTGQLGEFLFEGIAPGRYEVQIKKEKMFIFQNTVILERPEQDVMIFAVLPTARMIEVTGVSAPLPQGVTRSLPKVTSPAPGGEVQVAQSMGPLRVSYPAEAAALGVEGTVALYAGINPDGTVADAMVLSSPHELLTRAVLDSIGQARYRPMQLNGHPIACGINIQIEFKLTGD